MPTNRHMGIGIESSFGTQQAIQKNLRINDESLKEEIEWYDHETVAYNAGEESYPAKRWVSGDVNMAPCPDEIGEFLYCMLPNYSDGTTGVIWEHTFDDGTTSENSSLTINVQRDYSGRATYLGCKPSKMEFTAEVGKPLMVNASILGKRQSADNAAGSAPTFEADEVYMLTAGSIKVNGSVLSTVKALTISADWNYDADGDQAVGSSEMQDLRFQNLKVEGSITLTRPSTSIYGTYIHQDTAGSLHCKFTAYSSGGTALDLWLRIPKLHWQDGNEGNIDKRTLNEAEYKFVANYSTGSGFTFQTYLENNHGTAYPDV